MKILSKRFLIGYVERRDCLIRISTEVMCGILVLMDIALYEEDGKPVSVISISKRQNLSMKYLEQILMVLRRANLVRNLKGWKGGYIIAKPAKQITLRTVIDALDRTILADVTVQELIDDVALKEIINHSLWNPMTSYLRKFCDSITLFDLIEQYHLFRKNTKKTMH